MEGLFCVPAALQSAVSREDKMKLVVSYFIYPIMLQAGSWSLTAERAFRGRAIIQVGSIKNKKDLLLKKREKRNAKRL